MGKNWPGKPCDTISWLLDVSSPEDRNVRSIALRILILNIASLHPLTQTFTHAVFDLAVYPQFQEPLREEVKAVISQHGWSRESMTLLPKMDSFLKESQRVSTTTILPVMRKAMEDIIFSDGTKIPSGTHVTVASGPMHLDSRYYPNAYEFDPFRSCSSRKEALTKDSMNLSHLSFGHGKRKCPGQFFSSTMMTTMTAYLVFNYDMKLENDGVRPPDAWFVMSCAPNRTAEILFRRRPTC